MNKEWTKEYNKKYYKLNKDKIKSKSLKRYYINFDKIKVVNKKWRDENWKEYYERNKENILKNAKKNLKGKILEQKAWWTFRDAIKSGKIKRQPCEICGDKKSDGHHPDYKNPLEVIWLCRIHHAELHRTLRLEGKS